MIGLIFLQVCILIALIIFPFIKEKGLKLYRPVILVSIVYLVEFAIPVLYMLVDPESFYLYSRQDYRILIKGMWFIILVYAFFLIGYYVPYYNKHFKKLVIFLSKAIPNINNYTIQVNNLITLLIVLLVLGWISRVILVNASVYIHTETIEKHRPPPGFHLYAQYIGFGSMFPLVALALTFVQWLKNESKMGYLLTSLLLLAIEIIYAIPSGSKERMLLPLVIILILYSLKRRVPAIIIIPIIIFCVFFVFPFSNIYRSISLTGDLFVDLQRANLGYLKLMSRLDMLSLRNLFFNIFGQRLNSASIVVIIVENTPRIWDFKYGYTYLLFLVSIIPRIIWPGKPVIAAYYNDFGRDYGILDPSDFITSVGITWVGEMFINLGWFGVVFGFLYGFLYQLLYIYFMKYGKLTSLSLILYTFTLYHIIRGDSFAPVFSGLLKLALVLIIVFFPFLKKVKA